MNIDINAIMQGISIWGLPVLMAIVLHEVAHGWVAFKLGDDTAYWLGRLTLNPIKHIDPIGTLLIPIALLIMQSPFLFGYAKPVPINWKKLRNGCFGRPYHQPNFSTTFNLGLDARSATACILVMVYTAFGVDVSSIHHHQLGFIGI